MTDHRTLTVRWFEEPPIRVSLDDNNTRLVVETMAEEQGPGITSTASSPSGGR